MKYLLKRIRKWWLCRRYHICPTHGELMQDRGGYCSTWICDTCIEENAAKAIHRSNVDHLARIRAQEKLNKDWAPPRKEFE